MKKEEVAFNFWYCVLWSENYSNSVMDHKWN